MINHEDNTNGELVYCRDSGLLQALYYPVSESTGFSVFQVEHL